MAKYPKSRYTSGMDKTHNRIMLIARNGIVAGLYYALTMLMVLVPAISQFGPIQCRFSEFMVLLAFFDPSLTVGLTIGCLLANVTGFAMGQGFVWDILIGTGATLLACLFEAYLSKFLCIAALWPVVFNGLIVGTEIYFLFNDAGIPLVACMGYVALGELIAIALGYALFMVLVRRKGMLKRIGMTRHLEVKF